MFYLFLKPYRKTSFCVHFHRSVILDVRWAVILYFLNIFVTGKKIIEMKKYFLLTVGIFLLYSTVFAQNVELRDITSGRYSPKGAAEMVSSADGEFYFQTDDRKSQIIKYSYKTGLPVETVFDTRKSRECPFDSFEGFLMSPDEKRLLIYEIGRAHV